MWTDTILEDEAKIQRLPCSLQNFYKIRIVLSATLENTTKNQLFFMELKKTFLLKEPIIFILLYA